jgi:hypothetical protein
MEENGLDVITFSMKLHNHFGCGCQSDKNGMV